MSSNNLNLLNKSEQSSTGSNRNYNSKKILIVDDSEDNCEVLKKILSDDYEVIEATNGKEAMEILISNKDIISAVLIDTIMPDMDGYEFMKQVRKNENISDIPIIVTTQKDSQDDEIKALEAGALDFIKKPYNANIIRCRISNILKIKEASEIINVIEKDRLTGAFTREYFYQKAKEILSENKNKYDIVCTNIENFKLVNDLFGMKTGDALLKHFTEKLSNNFPEVKAIGKIGIDRFALLVPHIENANDKKFNRVINELNNFPIKVTLNVNFGIFVIDDYSLSINIMCDRALLAAKSIKGQYGKVFAYYSESIRKKLLDEQFITDSMDEAIQKNQFKVYLQPKYNIKNNKIVGAEALVRWIHPERGLMSPGEFIPLFERNGFITKLDFYVWEETCKLLKKLKDMGLNTIPISVNVSRSDLYNPNLADELLELIKKYELSTDLLHLEITETAYTENQIQIVSLVSNLKNRGFIIEMDDFGSGYSSLNMLSELPIDVLKLDMKFIQTEANGISNINILSFIISLAKWMQLDVIAEGVETKDQAERLKAMDCSFVQGYLYAKPMPSEDFFKFIADNEKDVQNNTDKTDGKEDKFYKHSKVSIFEKTMLIIDDMELNRVILAEIFNDKYKIVEAENGLEAIEILNNNKIDIVLLDLIMPVMDGFQVLSEMKSDNKLKKIPVIITSQQGKDSEELAIALGADDFISKPYSTTVCRARVHNVLDSAKSELYETELEILKKEAYYDYLTNLFNRRGFAQVINYRNNEPQGLLGLFVIDIDDLKACNDKYGHDSGDRMLVEFSQYLKSHINKDDIVARIGGDEFVVLTNRVSSIKDVEDFGLKLCGINSCDKNNGNCLSYSIGGIAINSINDVWSKLKKADEALYAAKKNGKNQCCFYNDGKLTYLPKSEKMVHNKL